MRSSSASFGVALAGALLISSGRMKKDAIDRDMVCIERIQTNLKQVNLL